MRDSRVGVAGGRELAYTDAGEPGWPCVFFFHGAPSSRLRLAYLEPLFLEKHISVVSPDRPGYGGSPPQPGRSLADSDAAALADALRIDRFIAAGNSSGGPYALACAALLPDRVPAGVTLGGVTDMGWAGAWEGYVESERELMRVPDEKLYEDEKIARLLAVARAEAFRQGLAGYAQDILIQGRPWPFDPAAIAAPIHILHGEADTLMPLAHARHTAGLILGSALRILPGHGHFTILAELPFVASMLASR